METNSATHQSKTSINSDMKNTQKHLLQSIIAVFFATAICDYILSLDLANIPDFLSKVISFFASWGMSIMGGMLVLMAAIEILKRGIGWFWHHYLEPPLHQYENILRKEVEKGSQDFTQNLEQKMTQLSGDLEGIMHHVTRELETFQEDSNHLLKDNILTSVVSRSEPEYIKKKIPFIHSKAYGPDCISADSLFHKMMVDLYPFLETVKLQRSHQNQYLVITEQNDSVTYEETIQYEIRSSRHYAGSATEESNTETYNVVIEKEYDRTSVDSLIIDISVDGKLIASLSDLLEISSSELMTGNPYSSKDSERLSLSLTDVGTIKLLFSTSIQVSDGEKADVKIYEKGIWDKSINSYVVSRNEPILGSNIVVTLPSNWKIKNFTVPDPDSWGNPNILQQCSNIGMASTNDWILPGIVLSCSWQAN